MIRLIFFPFILLLFFLIQFYIFIFCCIHVFWFLMYIQKLATLLVCIDIMLERFISEFGCFYSMLIEEIVLRECHRIVEKYEVRMSLGLESFFPLQYCFCCG